MIFEQVRNIISSELNIKIDDITLEKSLFSDLGADSIDAVEVIMALEDNFNIEISDEDAKDVKTVGDLVNLIEKLTAK